MASISMAKKLPIFEYISWFIKTYHETQQIDAPRHAYRLVDVKEKRGGEFLMTIQVIGTSSTFKSTPDEILNNEKIIEHFSSKDIRTICFLSKTADGAKSEIIRQKINDHNQIVFELRQYVDNSITQKTAKEISLNPNLIDTLSARDAHRVGYVSAHEQEDLA